MNCHLTTCLFQKLQDKNDGNGDELQKKEQEDAQKPPLNEELAEQSAVATRTIAETTQAATSEEVKLRKLTLQKYKVAPWKLKCTST